jgi:hypothetical protein
MGGLKRSVQPERIPFFMGVTKRHVEPLESLFMGDAERCIGDVLPPCYRPVLRAAMPVSCLF